MACHGDVFDCYAGDSTPISGTLTRLFFTETTNIDAPIVIIIANNIGPKSFRNLDLFIRESTADFHDNATDKDKACIMNSSNILRKESSSSIEGDI